MARVTYGALITELAGSIGGITFQRNSSGNTARLKPNMPVNPSESQLLQNIRISRMVPAWTALSQANKILWEAFAVDHTHTTPWGEVKTLNGFQWFSSCNINLLLSSQAMITAPPAWTAIAALPDFALFADAANFWLDWTPDIDVTGYHLFIYATPPIRQSSMKLRRSTFIIRKIVGDVFNTLNFQTQYASVFGVVWADIFNDAKANIIIRVKLIQSATGLASSYTSALIKLN